MAVLYISKAEAVRDPAALFTNVRAGFEVVIEDEGAPIARIVPPGQDEPEPDPEYDAWFRAQIEEALADPRPTIDSETVEAYFAARRRASALKILGMAG